MQRFLLYNVARVARRWLFDSISTVISTIPIRCNISEYESTIQIPGRFDRHGTLTVTAVSVSMSVTSGYRDHGMSSHGSDL